MSESYVLLQTKQLLSKTFFFSIKNKEVFEEDKLKCGISYIYNLIFFPNILNLIDLISKVNYFKILLQK